MVSEFMKEAVYEYVKSNGGPSCDSISVHNHFLVEDALEALYELEEEGRLIRVDTSIVGSHYYKVVKEGA